jgi:hypothetical protein
VIAVVMDEPSGGARDGGQVSAPVFREIAEQILPELEVVPDAEIRPDVLRAEDIPSEIEPSAVPVNEMISGENETPIPAKNDEIGKKAADTEKPKEPAPPKKENARPTGDKKSVRQKTAALINEKPKNKSSGERTKGKT